MHACSAGKIQTGAGREGQGVKHGKPSRPCHPSDCCCSLYLPPTTPKEASLHPLVLRFAGGRWRHSSLQWARQMGRWTGSALGHICQTLQTYPSLPSDTRRCAHCCRLLFFPPRTCVCMFRHACPVQIFSVITTLVTRFLSAHRKVAAYSISKTRDG